MKTYSLFLIAAFTLVSTGGSSVRAQQRVDMPELGVSVDTPAAWKQVRTSKVTNPLPAFGLYHLQDAKSGQFIAVRNEECTTKKKQKAWDKGEVAAKLKRGEDTLRPLGADAKVRFDEHTGFELTSPRSGVSFKAYVFYLSRDNRCYEVSVGSPEQAFETSSEAFQGLINGLSFAE